MIKKYSISVLLNINTMIKPVILNKHVHVVIEELRTKIINNARL